MKDYVYLYIEGSDFRPKEFQDCLDDTAKGTIEFHKKVEKGKVLQHKIHWKSRKIEVDNHDLAIEEILCLIEKIKHVFLDTRTAKTTIIAELVCFFCRRGEMCGVYVSAELVAAMAEVGASLDIDQYGPD